MTKIDIISGFLGAGKTTLIKKLLNEALNGEKLVLIENEFGEIGIDGGFLKDAGVEITEMNSGCICCSLVGDFGTALKEVIEKYAPDRIIIEPSGVGKLSDVIKAVNGIMEQEPDILLNSTTAVVDGLKTKMYMKNFGEFFNNQVESAGTIVISRTQKQPEQALKEVVEILREHNPNATVITTPWEEINGKQILSAMEKTGSLAEELLAEADVCPECGQHHGEDHHHHEGECCGHGHDHHHEGECHDHHHEGECHGHDHHEGECCGHGHDYHHEGECCGHDHHEGECCGHDHDHHHHHADEVFTSWGAETPRKYTEEEVRTALEKLADTEEYGVILRAKGMLPNVNGEWIYFDLVPGEYEIRTGSPEYTGRICVIGTKPDEDRLKELFCLNS